MNLFGFLNPKSYLAKGVFVVFAFVFFLIGTIYFLGHKTREQALQEKIEKLVPLSDEEKSLVSQKLQELSKDSDGDGLKDWEEIIYRTDPQNADTDGDGTKDGEEIKQNRDPLVAGPKDKNAIPKAELATENTPELENNLTQNFIKKLYETTGPSLATGGNIEQKTLETLASEIAWINPESVIDAIPVSLKQSDLVISPQNDATSVKKYFNSVYAVYTKTFLTLEEGDLLILARTLEEKNFDELKKMDKVIVAIDESFKGVKKIPVPKGYENFALKELRYLAQTKYIVENLKTVETDPLNALAMIQARLKIMDEVRKFHQDTGQELADKGITFNPQEGGYTLFQ